MADCNIESRTCFRPCIDLHEGKVKQIVGGTLKDEGEGPQTNFVSEQGAAYFARRYQEDGLTGGHVIMLGPNNESAAKEALRAYPDGLQLGGGVTLENAAQRLGWGASHVIVTSWLFDEEGRFLEERLQALSAEVGRERLVVDLSCRVVRPAEEEQKWVVAMKRWQQLTDVEVSEKTLEHISEWTDELLIHAADVEGKCAGMDEGLIAMLGQWGQKRASAGLERIPVTYAGGARNLEDLHRIQELSGGQVDLTIGSALDLFGGKGARYEDCVAFNR